MAGDNRTPDKTIGEVKYAAERAAHRDDKRSSGIRHAEKKPAAPAHRHDNAITGDNRTPEKTIGEVRYAEDRAAHPKSK